LYCQTAKKVLRAAKTGIVKKGKTASAMNAAGASVSCPIPKSIRDSIPNIPTNDLKDVVRDGFDIVRDMFKGDRIDTHLLGMESLVHLTSSCHQGKAVCSHFILSSELLETLLSLVLYSRMNVKVGSGSTSTSVHDSISELEQVHYSVMRRHALQILANCLTALDERMELADILIKMPILVADNLLSQLVLIVAGSLTQPHDAVDACRCLQKLCQHSEYVKRTVMTMGASIYLEHAQKCRHALLQDASIQLLHELKL
jgi:hypothetical protein